jgi:hypothetical protein
MSDVNRGVDLLNTDRLGEVLNDVADHFSVSPFPQTIPLIQSSTRALTQSGTGTVRM